MTHPNDSRRPRRPRRQFTAATLVLLASVGWARQVSAQCPGCIPGPEVVGSGTPASCTETALDAALAGGGWVTFNCGPDPVTVTVTSEKVITAPTTVDGGGRVTLSGGGAVTIFSVDASAALDVRNLTIADGHSEFSGGAIHNGGTLTLTNCTLRGNSASSDYGYGGAISNGGTATLTNCTLSGNSAVAGGGICNFPSGTLTLRNCTLRGNSAADDGSGGIAGWGGGIANLEGMLTLTNCTLSGNSAVGGGGIANVPLPCPSTLCGGCSSSAIVTNSTFSGNSADAGAGAIDGCPTSLTNSIIASSSGANCGEGGITDGGHNLQWPGTDCGETISSLDPLLDPDGLKDNGGPTQTIALLPGSPAINAGDPDACANPPVNGVDQRGYARPGTGSANCSIGAFEYDAPGPTPGCVGDCTNDGTVTVDDLITMVTIALDAAPMSACAAGDVNADGEMTVEEIITAVSVALGSCPTGPPFPWEPGPFGVGVRQMAFTKQSATHPAEERVLLTDIWYPTEPDAGPIDATLGGVVDAPRAAHTGNLPLLLFSHGSCGNPEQSRFLTTTLASYGFVVAAPPHRGNVLSDFPSFDDCQALAASTYAALSTEREADIRFVIDSLLQLNADPESFFAAAIDPNRIGVSGHSFGGETTQRVCARDPRVQAGLVLAMGPAVPGRTIHVPIMVHAGERDSFVPFGAVQLLFQGLGAPKYLVEIFHTGHTAFIDDCLVFFPACDGAGPGALTQDEAHQLVLRYAVPFLLHHVAGDGRFDAYLGPAPGVAFTADTGEAGR